MSEQSQPKSDWYRGFNFLKGAMSLSQLPEDSGHEVVFAGRSNVGKSSVINAFSGRRALARTSKTPGRTRELNYFVNETGQRLVDLPGYGFARVSNDLKRKWARLLADYFANRQSIQGIILIMDIRHPLTVFDEQMLTYSNDNGIPTHILLNKSDKLSKGVGLKVLQQVKQQIQANDVSVQLFSASKRLGVDETRQILFDWLFTA